MKEQPSVHILGRFPPPVDGQALATQRVADLLEASRAVHRLNTSPGETGARVRSRVTFRPARLRHYLHLSLHLRRALEADPSAPVLWTSISPAPLGHLRDVLTTARAFLPQQPVYAVVHWGNFDRVFRSRLTSLTARRLVRRLRGVVFLTPSLATRCAAWVPPPKRIVIPNTIDASLFCTEEEVAARQAARREGTTTRLLFLSNMIASKGYLDVLEAVALLHRRGLPVEADFAGSWESDADRALFLQRVEAYGLAPVVRHHGPVHDRGRVKALHLAADVFVLPTSYPTEAQPLVLLEALNAGTPVVTTRHAGIPDMVREDQEARFVPPGDPAAIADAVAVLADPARWHAFSKRARRRFTEHFSPETVRHQWERLLQEG